MGLHRTERGNHLAELLRLVRPIAYKQLDENELQLYNDAWGWVNIPDSRGNRDSMQYYIRRICGLLDKYNLINV